jgi:sensor domain CHASE-containing protein
VFYGSGFDVAAKQSFPLSEVFAESLTPGHLLTQHQSIESAVRGLLETPRGPMVIVSRPVLTSEVSGPIMGTLIFGRVLNAPRLAAMRQQTEVEFTLTPTTGGDLTPADRAASERLTQSQEPALHEKADGLLLSYDVLEDIYGRPAFLIRVQTPQEIASLGMNAVQLAVGLVVVGGFVFMAALWVLLQRLILAPMSDLTGHILERAAT